MKKLFKKTRLIEKTVYNPTSELKTFQQLLNKFPKGILSIVSDTFDLWKVLTEYLPVLKSQIMSRNGKLVIRPDSGDPVDIICGIDIPDMSNHKYCPKGDLEGAKIYMQDEVIEQVQNETPHGECGDGSPTRIFKYEGKYYSITISIEWNRYDKQYYYIDGKSISEFKEIEALPKYKGVIELEWEVFGGTVNAQGYKVLDSHIGAIYGDSINMERAKQICDRLKKKRFASTNIVLGIGSYTYQMNTRDTFGFAVKATYGEVLEIVGYHWNGDHGNGFEFPDYATVGREIFKDPITDDGTKKSAKGLLQVYNGRFDASGNDLLFDGLDEIKLADQMTKEREKGGLLQTVFINGELKIFQTLDQIRKRLKGQAI